MKTKIIIEKFTQISLVKKPCEIIMVSTLEGSVFKAITFKYLEENGKVKCI